MKEQFSQSRTCLCGERENNHYDDNAMEEQGQLDRKRAKAGRAKEEHKLGVELFCSPFTAGTHNSSFFRPL